MAALRFSILDSVPTLPVVYASGDTTLARIGPTIGSLLEIVLTEMARQGLDQTETDWRGTSPESEPDSGKWRTDIYIPVRKGE